MKRLSLLIAFSYSLYAFAEGGPASWDFSHRSLSGQYGVYGGSLGDPVAPKRNDSKIMFSLDGAAARDMFEAMGPDVKDVCTEGSSDRVRKKDNDRLRCTRTAKGEYFCNFGFDLRTGKSIGGIVC